LLGLQLPLPPIHEQRRIVDILSRADGIVRLRREAEKKAAELIPALFLDMFGDPATNPKSWLVETVGDVIESADYGSSTKSSEDGSGLPIIRMGNVDYAGTLNLANLKFVNLPDAEAEKYRLREGDILFNRTNSKDLVGKTGLWGVEREAVIASYFIRLRVDRDRMRPSYLWAFMNSRHMKRVLFDTARGAIGQANINSKELKAFPIAVPPLKLQQDFATRLEEIRSIQSQQSAAAAKAQSTFDALLAQVFASN
jgi:type I restriction enzyme S subunit